MDRFQRRQNGYALLIILLLVSLLAISLAAAAPGWLTALKRRREQAAIDYARQYVMGIRRYYHKFGAYPPNLDRLKETNGVYYLRRAWPDPLVKSGKWYLIHPGDLIAPKVQGAPGGAPGAASSSAASGATGEAPFGAPGGPGTTPGMAGAMGAAGLAGILPQAVPGGPQTAFGTSPTAATGAPGTMGFTLPQVQGGSIRGIEVITGYRLRKQSDSFSSVGAGPIIGVAIPSDQPAVHEFNGKDRPDQWLFLYLPTADHSLGGAAPQGPVAPGAGVPGQNNSPFGSPSPSPTGSPTGGPPGGPGVGPNGGGALGPSGSGGA